MFGYLWKLLIVTIDMLRIAKNEVMMASKFFKDSLGFIIKIISFENFSLWEIGQYSIT